ncbi:MAG: HlyD family efflux transporter periplasmic adaptor subunit [Pseudomonadota bacterium]
MIGTPESSAENGAGPQTKTGRRDGRLRWLLRQTVQVVLSVGVMFVAIQGTRWLVDTAPATARVQVEEAVYQVNTIAVDVADRQPTISAFGAIEARRTVELRALVQGPVVEVHPSLVPGERIAKGTALVRIDQFAYEGAVFEAKANLAEAEAGLVERRAQLDSGRVELERAEEQLALAQRDLQRSEALVQRNVANERSVDDRRLTLSQRRQAVDVAEAALALWTARIAQQEATLDRLKWRIREAERNLADTVLRAPFDAVVRREAVEPGRRLSINDLVAELYEDGALDVRFTLSDEAYGSLLESERLTGAAVIGRKGTLAWRVGNETIPADIIIERIGPDVRSELGGVEIFAQISGPSLKRLRPGAFVKVTLPGRQYADAAVVPEASVYGGDHVFAVIDGRLERRDVRVLAWYGETAYVDGPLDGAEVLVTRLTEAGDGVRVRTSLIGQTNEARVAE